ncbi:MAG TPA: TetR family transcriptional regulator [Trebonia sp.]|nr:TetR family transcriptional regulator [Trebonia sp.]
MEHVKLEVDGIRHGSLRERKKARTRAAIREHALRLFRAQGYAATTVEQIAAAAEVSPSTFFRYFPTKEDVVLRDDFDARMFEAFERQPASLPPVAALRAAIRESIATLTPEEWAEFREMSAFAVSVPEIRARMLDEMTRTMAEAAAVLARRLRRAPEDLTVRTYVGAVFGAIMAVMGPETYSEGNIDAQGFDRIDQALALLEAGLPRE